MVEVAVGQQHRDGTEVVLTQQRVELLVDTDARVDDDALAAGSGCDDVAVGVERSGGEPADQHGRPL